MNTVEGTNKTDPINSVELLRTILEHEQDRQISYDEAVEVGDCLISFFELLAQTDGI